MKLTNKTILLISPEPWGINYVSKHHYAIELAKKGDNVYFLNPPSNKFNIRREREKLFIFDYKPTYKGLAKLPPFISAWLIKKEVRKLEQICNATFDIIWNFDSSSFFNLKLLKSKFRISHIVDLSENKNIKLLNTTVDLCLSTSSYILERQLTYNKNAHNIGHGYAISENTQPISLPKTTGKLKVGYVGNLLIKYLDWPLICKLISQHPEINFYFAGPYAQSNLSKVQEMPPYLKQVMGENNTYFMGAIKSSQIPSFLSQMDVLLLAYKADEFKEQLSNPHKMMEYLGSGKVVVATQTTAYYSLATEGIIAMAAKNKEYAMLFNEVVNKLAHWNSTEFQQKRRDFALNNTYEKQVGRIEKLINKKINE